MRVPVAARRPKGILKKDKEINLKAVTGPAGGLFTGKTN